MDNMNSALQQASVPTETQVKADDLDFYSLLRRQGGEGRLYFNQQRVVIFDTAAITALRQQLVTMLGSDIAKTILTHFGYTQGYQDAERLSNDFNWSTDEEWLKAGFSLQTLSGVAYVEIEDIKFDRTQDEFFVRGIWHNSFEADEYIKRNSLTNDTVCWMLSGYISGYATRFFGQEVLAVEQECLGKGDAHCYFEIHPTHEWPANTQPTSEMLQETGGAHQTQITQGLQKQTHQLMLLNELGTELSVANTLDDIFNIALAKTHQIIGGDRASIARLDADATTFTVFALQGLDANIPAGTKRPIEGSMIQQAIEEDRVLIIPDIRASELFQQGQLTMQDIRSVIVIPLKVGDQLLGTLNIGSKKENFYTARDENLVLQISSLLDGAIENRHLFEQAQKRAIREEILRKVTDQVRSSVDIDTILRTTAKEIGQALNRPAFAYLEKDDQAQPPLEQKGT